jgi:hypothetical protein
VVADRGSSGTGLSALYSALDAVADRHGLSGIAVVVDDPELGHQVFAAGDDARVARDACSNGAGRRWCTVPESEDVLPEIEPLQVLAATSLRLAAVDPSIDAASALEVAVRRLADVRGVERTGSAVRVLAGPGSHAAVVGQVVALELGSPVVVVEVAGEADSPVGSEPDGPTGRVELVAVLSRPETTELEVHLRYGNRRTVGRGPLSRAAAGAAEATLDALMELGFVDDGRIAWARTFDTTPERQFLVGVALGRADGPTLYGFASGGSPIESAARATLDAVNRTITVAPRGN